MFARRLKIIKENIKKERLEAVFISSVASITYLTGYANFSEIEREAYLIITKDEQYIITDGRYSEAIKKQVPHFTLFERGHKSNTEDLLKSLKKKVISLGIEEVNLTVSEYKLVKKYFKTKHFEAGKQRSIKTSEELDRIKKACKVGDLAFELILKKIKAEVTEKEIAYELEHFIKQQNADLSFPPIVAFGGNCAVPHHHTGNSVLEKKDGQFILLDFGVKFQNYCSDMTRTIFFGKPIKKQKDIYETVLTAQTKTLEYLNSAVKSKRKIKAADIDKVARDYIKSKGYPTIPHSLGHGIGLQVHEHPYIATSSNEVLKEGMVFSIEPGIYIPGFGGVRIEDLFVIEENKIKQITRSPKQIISVKI